METLLSVQPDVVISATVREDVIAAMENNGVPVVVLSSYANPDELKRGISILAETLGPAEQQVAQRFTQLYDPTCKGSPPARRPVKRARTVEMPSTGKIPSPAANTMISSCPSQKDGSA
jgi:ABC-type hemin transport system substrate-binding protein